MKFRLPNTMARPIRRFPAAIASTPIADMVVDYTLDSLLIAACFMVTHERDYKMATSHFLIIIIHFLFRSLQ